MQTCHASDLKHLYGISEPMLIGKGQGRVACLLVVRDSGLLERLLPHSYNRANPVPLSNPVQSYPPLLTLKQPLWQSKHYIK